MRKTNYVALVNQFSALNSKDALTKSEIKELRKLRRTLESYGINTDSSDLMDRAIILDNRAQVEGYLSRSTDAEMYYAKRSNGKNIGKIKANQLEADELKELGLSTTDPKRLSKLLTEITSFKKSIEKTKHGRRKNAIRSWNEAQYQQLVNDFSEDSDTIDEPMPYEGIDYDEITIFATKAFMPA